MIELVLVMRVFYELVIYNALVQGGCGDKECDPEAFPLLVMNKATAGFGREGDAGSLLVFVKDGGRGRACFGGYAGILALEDAAATSLLPLDQQVGSLSLLLGGQLHHLVLLGGGAVHLPVYVVSCY